MSLEKAFAEVHKLVSDFKKGEKHYLSQSYQEAEARKDFIDKFFIALGWDVNHIHQRNPYEQEVKVEKSVTVSGAQKRADYSFSLAPNYRDPKFFVEAKKPSNDIYNSDNYFQTIRYGWHKGTPIAVLTDFKEFHILDCRYTPDINNSLDKCFKRFHYTDYLNKEKFGEIYFLFSREEVANSSIEKVAESLPKRKGKVTTKTLFPYEVHQTIDEAFLEVIDGIRETLAKAFKKQDDRLTSEELTEATQRTIDRLVFIRFLEDKLIEQEHYVSEFGEKGTVWNDFISACRKLDAKYNGIVFKEHFIDKQNFAGAEESEFRTICQDICHLNSRFLFNEIPIHILGSIYERFLGKVVNATAKRVTVEEKHDVQKAGGVYYTPKYVVDYIVYNTVGKIIKDKTPDQVAKLRFADIACGSGSFLIGVFDCLLDYHNKYYQEHPDKAKKDKCIKKDGQWVLSIKQKQKILINNIYGVDIDQQATEVTQLSLALKMLEDESTATANEMQVFFHEKILPDMSKNIICGNSLIGTDILTQTLFEGDEERKVNAMDFATVFKDVMRNGGFDAVIGNPPYVMLQNLETREVFDYSLAKFRSAKYKIDTYQLFTEQSIRLLKDGGLLGYITPNTFLKNIHSEPLRKYILENTVINEILLFNYSVFSASVDTCVFIFEKGNATKKNELSVNLAEVVFQVKEVAHVKQSSFWNNNRTDFNLLISGSDTIVLNKIGLQSKALLNYCGAYFGIQTFDRDKYVSKEKTNKNFEPVIDGGNIEPYYLKSSNEYVNYTPSSIKSGGNEIIYRQERICIRQIGATPIATIVPANIFTLNTIYNVYLKEKNIANLSFLLGIINSKTTKYFWRKNNSDEKKTFPKIKKEAILSIPIPEIKPQNHSRKSIHDKIVLLVEQMIKAKTEINHAKTDKDRTYFERKCSSLETGIDNEVYKLYDFTEDEIKIVEGENKK
jgi:adenine-specific DNA-methyltransferase